MNKCYSSHERNNLEMYFPTIFSVVEKNLNAYLGCSQIMYTSEFFDYKHTNPSLDKTKNDVVMIWKNSETPLKTCRNQTVLQGLGKGMAEVKTS